MGELRREIVGECVCNKEREVEEKVGGRFRNASLVNRLSFHMLNVSTYSHARLHKMQKSQNIRLFWFDYVTTLYRSSIIASIFCNNIFIWNKVTLSLSKIAIHLTCIMSSQFEFEFKMLFSTLVIVWIFYIIEYL
jgi:hypothetical protein